MKSWKEFYSNKLNKEYQYYIQTRYSPYINFLNQLKGNSFLEIGCGISSITKLIYDKNKKFIISDKSSKMLHLSNINLKELKVQSKIINAIKFIDNRVDVIHSHGMLEHLTPNQMKQSVECSLRQCKTLVHYVPSNKYNYKSFGDELLISPKEWGELVDPSEIIEFNNGFDLILIWENKCI